MRRRCVMICSAFLLGCSPAAVPAGGSGAMSGGAGGTGASGAAPDTGGASGRGGVTGTGGVTGPGSMTGTGGVNEIGGRGIGGMPGTGGAVGMGGGTSAGGSSPLTASYFIGTDISRVETDPAGTTYTDNDGTRKDLLVLLKGHGFNYIRVRTFVDPNAADGNTVRDQSGFYDIPHTINFGKRIKDAAMGFLLDFHYADNWADPGKQCVPVAWQSLTTIAALGAQVHDYTKDAITRLVAGGARPDMVQIGNEITPGMLLHRCDAAGLPTGPNPVTGPNSTAGWPNLGVLLKSAAQGIKDVDTGIKIMLHIDRAQDFAGSRSFIMNAIAQGVPFDVFGESSYTLYQGPPAGWMSTFTQLAAAFPALKFVSAEYGPEQRAINDIIFNLPNRQGIGTFYWEATHSGTDNAGHLLFSNRVAQPDLLLYDLMKTDYASRL